MHMVKPVTAAAPVAANPLLELARAFAAEIKFGYTNLQGKRARFAEFALEQVLGLKEHPGLYQDGGFAQLLAQMDGYGGRSEAERREVLRRCRLLLLPHLARSRDQVLHQLYQDWSVEL